MLSQSSYIAAEICSVRQRSIGFLTLAGYWRADRQPRQFAQASYETEEATTVYISTVTANFEPIKSYYCSRRDITFCWYACQSSESCHGSRQMWLTMLVCVIDPAETLLFSLFTRISARISAYVLNIFFDSSFLRKCQQSITLYRMLSQPLLCW